MTFPVCLFQAVTAPIPMLGSTQNSKPLTHSFSIHNMNFTCEKNLAGKTICLLWAMQLWRLLDTAQCGAKLSQSTCTINGLQFWRGKLGISSYHPFFRRKNTHWKTSSFTPTQAGTLNQGTKTHWSYLTIPLNYESLQSKGGGVIDTSWL